MIAQQGLYRLKFTANVLHTTSGLGNFVTTVVPPVVRAVKCGNIVDLLTQVSQAKTFGNGKRDKTTVCGCQCSRGHDKRLSEAGVVVVGAATFILLLQIEQLFLHLFSDASKAVVFRPSGVIFWVNPVIDACCFSFGLTFFQFGGGFAFASRPYFVIQAS